MNSGDIFGPSLPLYPARIKGNAKFVALWATPFLICIAGGVVAVKTGITWIGAASGAICICALFFVAILHNVKYRSAFGKNFHISKNIGCDLLISSFGWTAMALSFAIMLITKLNHFRNIDAYVADIVDIIEIFALTGFIGSIMFGLMFILLYI